tara:strand:- start:34 stop:408 length:375 start_codon:yes stop_codon:yes gene_type:complete
MSDMGKFEIMFEQQKEFLELLRDKRDFPDFPLDLSEKKSQQFLKSLAHECMHELFESNMLLKNAKSHRSTEISDFDRDAYTEELSDVLHYLIGILLYSGISYEEMYKMYMKKGQINLDRINGGY